MPNNIGISNQRGALRVSGDNARYFTDNSGKAIYLAGFHTWYNVQDGGASDPAPVFDWDEYLQELLDYGCNCTKLWASLETPRGWSHDNDQWIGVQRYNRTGPGNANDGGLKFDVTSINPAYLARLRSRVAACAKANIYVVIQLFQGWQVESGSIKGQGDGTPGLYHPYNTDNNVNSLNPDDNANDDLREAQYFNSNPALTYQENMVAAIIDTVNEFENVLFEICNEPTGSTENTDWQEHLISYIQSYESDMLHQHPVGMTVQWPSGDNAACDASGAAWVSYNGDKADSVHSASDPVSIYDTDHTVGLAAESDLDWVWTSLCEGHGAAFFMDAWDGAMFGTDWRAMSGYIVIRANVGYARTLTKMLRDLLGMTPQAALSSSGFCLAKNHATAGEYIAFYSGASTFTLNLTTATGTLNIRWLRCSDGTVQDSATVSGGAIRTLTPPWTGEVVAYVRHL